MLLDQGQTCDLGGPGQHCNQPSYPNRVSMHFSYSLILEKPSELSRKLLRRAVGPYTEQFLFSKWPLGGHGRTLPSPGGARTRPPNPGNEALFGASLIGGRLGQAELLVRLFTDSARLFSKGLCVIDTV